MQFGNVSADDLRYLLTLLPLLEKQEREIRQLLLENRDRLFSRDCHNPSWASLYEYPFPEHVARIVIVFDMTDEVKEIGQSPSQVAALRLFIDELERDDSEFTTDEKEALRPGLAGVLGIVTSLLRSFQCLMAYGCYINELIAVVRCGGEKGDSALMKAVRIDPTSIGTPSVLARISQATLEDDRLFLNRVKKAINGGLSKQAQANSQKIRLVLQILREAGAAKLSDDVLCKLFVDELKLYSVTKKAEIGDAAKSIKAIQDRMKKAKATT